jgi:hypothetical protein
MHLQFEIYGPRRKTESIDRNEHSKSYEASVGPLLGQNTNLVNCESNKTHNERGTEIQGQAQESILRTYD